MTYSVPAARPESDPVSLPTDRPQRRLPPRTRLAELSPRWLLVTVTWAAGLLVIGVAIYLAVRLLAQVTFVLVPVAVALLLTALLDPVNRRLRRHLPRGLAAAVTLLLLIVVLVGVVAFAFYRTASQFDALYAEFSTSLSTLRQNLINGPLPVDAQMLNQVQQNLQQSLQSGGSGLVSIALTGAERLVRFAVGAFLMLFVLFFLLYDGQRTWSWLVGRLPDPAGERVVEAGKAAWRTLAGFMRGTFFIAVIHCLVIGTALFLLGVPVFLTLALLVFLGSFVPLVGALVAGGLAVLVTLGTQGLLAGLVLLLILFAENELEAHVLQPLVVGRFVRLHPLAIVLVLALGTTVGGIIGTLVAVPVTGVLYNAWGPLQGRPATPEPQRSPSRLQRLWRRLRQAVRHISRAAVSPSPTARRASGDAGSSDRPEPDRTGRSAAPSGSAPSADGSAAPPP